MQRANRPSRPLLSIAAVMSLAAGLVAVVASPAAAAVTDLYIDQYVEGTGFNKAIEIANGGTTDLTLVGTLELYSNGSAAATNTDPINETIAAGASIVLYNASASQDIIDRGTRASSAVNWNGDDAIVLRDDTGTVIDSIGQVGVDPGTTWPGTESTQDNTICKTTASADTDPTDAYSTTGIWTSLGTNVFTGLGTIGCEDPPPIFIDQYVEGTSNNKAIEIANGGTTDVTLVGTLELYSNGSAAATNTDPINETIAAGASIVLYNASASQDIIDRGTRASSAVNWNGDDAIVLRDDTGTVIDSIGQVGVDPGTTWPGTESTQDNTICKTTASADTDPTDAYSTTGIWTSLGTNVFTGLGTIGCEDGGTGPTPAVVLIHQIQGSGAVTPILGLLVEVEAIVTGLYEDDDALDGFFLQEEDLQVDGDPNTSEGVFVFCRSNCPAGLAVGDLVTTTGFAEENFGMTQIDQSFGQGTTTIASSGNPLPTATSISLPAATGTDVESTFESTESMLVTIPTTLAVSEYFELARFGSIVLTANERPYQFTHTNAPGVTEYAAFLADLAKRRIVLDDNNSDQNDAIAVDPINDEPYAFPQPGGFSTTNFFRGGDTITGLTGIFRWAFGEWSVVPVPEAYDYTFTPANVRTTVPDDVGGSLKVASFNVLNYFTTIDSRGADSAAELARQRDKIVAAIGAIDADIVGLIEIENNTAAIVDLVAGLDAALGAGTYAYVDTGVIGTDEIKVAFIYKPATVALSGAYAILDTSVDPDFLDTKNRPVLIQTFEQLATGEQITVAVNHFKSKGSACDDVSDPDLDDGQANCNLTRTKAANALASYLATDPTGSGDPDHLIIGDLNSYAMEDPIVALENAGYTDLIESFQGPDGYSYVFDGQLGYLDYALANDALLPQVTGTAPWHINADEVPVLDYNDGVLDAGEQSFERESTALPIYDPDPYRASDHDPVVVGLDLESGPPVAVLVAGSAAPSPGDVPVADLVRSLGFDLVIVDDDTPDLADAVTALDPTVVLVSSTVVLTKVGSSLANLPVGVVTWEAYLYDEFGFTTGGSYRNGETAPQNQVDVLVPGHPIADGLSGRRFVSTSTRAFSFLRPTTGTVVATEPGQNRPVIVAWDDGETLSTGATAPARRVAMFPTYSTPPVFTADGETLLANAIIWAADATPVIIERPNVVLIAGSKSPPPGDRAIRDRILAADVDLTIVDDDDAATLNLNGVDAIFVSTSVVLGKVGNVFKNAAVPVVMWEAYLFDDMGFGPSGESTANTSITITAPGDGLAAGLSGTVPVYSTGNGLSYARVAPSADVIAHETGRTIRATVFRYEAGDTLADGSTAAALRIGIFPNYFGAQALTAGGSAIIDAAIAEAISP